MTQPAGRCTYCQSKAQYSWNIFQKISPYKPQRNPVQLTFLDEGELLSGLRVPEGHPLLRAPVGVLGDGRGPRPARQLLEAVVAEALLAGRARRHVEREGRAVRRTALGMKNTRMAVVENASVTY